MFVVTATADWWGRLSRWTKLAAFVGAAMGAVSATAIAWPTLEPWVYASHGWSRSEIHEPLLQRLVKIQLKQNHDEREQLLEEVKKRELELTSDQAKATPQYQELVQQRVNRVKERLNELDKDDANLFKEKASK